MTENEKRYLDELIKSARAFEEQHVVLDQLNNYYCTDVMELDDEEKERVIGNWREISSLVNLVVRLQAENIERLEAIINERA